MRTKCEAIVEIQMKRHLYSAHFEIIVSKREREGPKNLNNAEANVIANEIKVLPMMIFRFV